MASSLTLLFGRNEIEMNMEDIPDSFEELKDLLEGNFALILQKKLI